MVIGGIITLKVKTQVTYTWAFALYMGLFALFSDLYGLIYEPYGLKVTS